jgi:DNA-binding CsgD family transcriptional regulator
VKGFVDFDPITAVETFYRTDLSSPAWLLAAIEAVQPLIDPQRRGVQGGFYQCPDPLSFMPEAPPTLFHFDHRLEELFFEGMHHLSEEFVVGTFLCPGVARGATLDGWNEIPPVRSGALRAHGVADVVNLVAVEPDGSGCGIGSFRDQPAILPPAERHLLQSIARHFMAAHRIHRRLRCRGKERLPDLADAVLDSDGRVHHARGAAARDPGLRQALRTSLLRSEQSRGRRRRRDPQGAIGAWDSLVAGRWTLVDHFDHDGRRYLLAVENCSQSPSLDLLSPRERAVAEGALRGLDNKVIAYELGVAHSTVKVLLARAAFKLGCRTRRELVARLRLRSSK